MPTSVSTLIQRTRRFLRDWPEEDVLTASLASNGTTITVADGLLYADNWLLEIDQETLFVNGNGSGTSATVRRAVRGSTAASHVTASTVLIRPTWTYLELLDGINFAKDECYPRIYLPVLDTSLTAAANTFEYTVPNMPGTYSGDTIPIPYLSKIEVKPTGETEYVPVRGWSIRRGATPKIQFSADLAPGTFRVHGFGPYPDLATGDSLSAVWPRNADKLLPVGAAAHLLASRESDRASGRGMQDDVSEWAKLQGAGAALSASDRLWGRFQRQLLAAAMPPMPPHRKPTF
jgi:hypothetical protein